MAKRDRRSIRNRDYWVSGRPTGCDPQTWDLFLAYGRILDAALASPRGIALTAQDGRLVDTALAGRAEYRTLPVQPSFFEEAQGPRLAKMGSPLQDPAVAEAFSALAAPLGERFRFLRPPSGEDLPLIVRLALAILCSRPVVKGDYQPIQSVRGLISLIAPAPSAASHHIEALLAYLLSEFPMVQVTLALGQLSPLDGHLALSPRGAERLLKVPPHLFTSLTRQADRPPFPPANEERFVYDGTRPEPQAKPAPRPVPGPPPPGARPQREEERPAPGGDPEVPATRLEAVSLSPSIMGELEFLAGQFRADRAFNPVSLFHGPPGTGKTLSVSAIAGEAGRPLLGVSLPELLGKFVGETEGRLDLSFKRAVELGAVLHIDEADALLFPRQDARHSWERSCTNTLLKLLEKAACPVFLCTNFMNILDEAVLRRIHYMVEFPLPTHPERFFIWEIHLKAAGLGTEVDLFRLAQVELSGGLIANAVKQAEMRLFRRGGIQAVTTEALLNLAEKELQKMGAAAKRPGRGDRIGFAPAPEMDGGGHVH